MQPAGCRFRPGGGAVDRPFGVPGQAAATAQPARLDHPPSVWNDDLLDARRPFDDLNQVRNGLLLQHPTQLRVRPAAVCKELPNPRHDLQHVDNDRRHPIPIPYFGGVNMDTIGRPSTSTVMCRSRPVIRLPASTPLAPPLSVVVTPNPCWPFFGRPGHRDAEIFRFLPYTVPLLATVGPAELQNWYCLGGEFPSNSLIHRPYFSFTAFRRSRVVVPTFFSFP